MSDQNPDNRELARRLTAYADAHLSPEPAAMTKIRSELVARADGSTQSSAPISIQAWHRSRARRLGMSLLAASLVLALLAGAVVAARPGGPFYPIKLWLESVTLPADPAARVAAELARLENRLTEVSAASAARDAAALSAALDAYSRNLDTVISSGAPDDVQADLESALSRHVTLLHALTDEAPEAARGAIEEAVARGSQAIDRLLERDSPPLGDPPFQGDSPADVDPQERPPSAAPAGPDAAPTLAPEPVPPTVQPEPAPPTAAPEPAPPAPAPIETPELKPDQSPSEPRP